MNDGESLFGVRWPGTAFLKQTRNSLPLITKAVPGHRTPNKQEKNPR